MVGQVLRRAGVAMAPLPVAEGVLHLPAAAEAAVLHLQPERRTEPKRREVPSWIASRTALQRRL